MDELRTLTELMAERCGLEPDYMGELLELYRRTANRIEAIEPMVAEIRKDTDHLRTVFNQLVDAAGAQQDEQQAAEPEAYDFKPIITGSGAQEKLAVMDRLERLRKAGHTVKQIAQAAGMTEGEIMDFFERKQIRIGLYRQLDAGLAKLDR